MKSATQKAVRAHMDRNGIVVFRLLKGGKKTPRAFGYGTHNKMWLRLTGLGTGTVVMRVEWPAVVKEEIAGWMERESEQP